jgi:hypothetical protein
MPRVHLIYHIRGRKVGCTTNLDSRQQMYLRAEGRIPEMEILEVLRNKTDQEAGDIEWQWADRFGYHRGTHYLAARERQQQSANFVSMTMADRSRDGSISSNRRSIGPNKRIGRGNA